MFPQRAGSCCSCCSSSPSRPLVNLSTRSASHQEYRSLLLPCAIRGWRAPPPTHVEHAPKPSFPHDLVQVATPAADEMQWTDLFCHPLWVVSTAMLAMVVRLQRRGRWDPRACPVQLKGKTAIVTGANTGRAFNFSLFKFCRSKVAGISLQRGAIT